MIMIIIITINYIVFVLHNCLAISFFHFLVSFTEKGRERKREKNRRTRAWVLNVPMSQKSSSFSMVTFFDPEEPKRKREKKKKKKEKQRGRREKKDERGERKEDGESCVKKIRMKML